MRRNTRTNTDATDGRAPVEKAEVVTVCDHLGRLRFSHVPPNAFTEHGAIMVATVLNSPRAVENGWKSGVKPPTLQSLDGYAIPGGILLHHNNMGCFGLLWFDTAFACSGTPWVPHVGAYGALPWRPSPRLQRSRGSRLLRRSKTTP